MTPRRGEIWLVDFGEPVAREQAGTRPAVVVSTDALNEGPSGVVLAVTREDVHRTILVDTENRPEIVGRGGQLLHLRPQHPQLLTGLFQDLGQLVVAGQCPVESIPGVLELLLELTNPDGRIDQLAPENLHLVFEGGDGPSQFDGVFVHRGSSWL